MGEPRSEWVVRRPPPRMVPLVGRYVGYRMSGHPPGVHRGFPSRHLTFIVSIGPAIDVVAQTDPAQSPGSYRAVVGGLQASTARIAHPGHQEGVAIELTPLGARALLGTPARALWNASVELADVVGPVGDELWERLQHAPTWQGRFAAIDDVLSRLAAPRAVTPELGWAWGQLVASGGAIEVAALAREVGWTRQHLTRRFREEFGLGPKLAGRVLRFERALALVRAPTAPPLAEVAAACGYYDQAHLTRDFTALAGAPPRQVRIEEDLPSFQDEGGGEPR